MWLQKQHDSDDVCVIFNSETFFSSGDEICKNESVVGFHMRQTKTILSVLLHFSKPVGGALTSTLSKRFLKWDEKCLNARQGATSSSVSADTSLKI